MTRYRAAACHLAISLVIFVGLAWLVLFVWFPSFFFAIDGGWEGMRILIGVDLVLGSLLTLIVFRSGKPGLRFDLTLIGLFQALCLAAGLYVIYSERPIFFVYYEQHFYSSSADTFTSYGLAAPDYHTFGASSPAMVYVALPDNPIEEADVRRILYDDNVPPWAYPPLYRPLADHLDVVVREAMSIADVEARDQAGNLRKFVERHGGVPADYAFVPIHSRYRDVFLGIRKSDRAFIDIVDIPPPMG